MAQDSVWLVWVGKWMLLTLFLAAGALNLAPARVKDHIDRMAAWGVPMPAHAFWIGLAMQFTAIAGGIFHRFWLVEDPMRRQMLRIALLNNIAVIGGLLVLLAVLR